MQQSNQTGMLVDAVERAETAYYHCVRELSLAAVRRVESGELTAEDAQSPKLSTARDLYIKWQKLLPPRS